jgi:lambda family phage portal protein
MAAIVQAVFAATIEGAAPTDEILQNLLTPMEQALGGAQGLSPIDQWFEAQSGWYDQKNIDDGINGRIAHMFPGQNLKFNTSQTPNATYKDFSRDLLREMARCAGVTYESWTGDYAGVTFSSVRFATDEIWRIVSYRRKNIITPFCQPAYEAWLEEEIDRGTIQLPGGIDQFIENRAGICNAEWKGTPKPTADELKAANAQLVRRGMNIASDRMLAAENGDDIDEVYAEIAEEQKKRESLGIPEGNAVAVEDKPEDKKEPSEK